MTTDTFHALLWWLGVGFSMIWVFILAYVLKRMIEVRRRYLQAMGEVPNDWEQGQG